MDAASSCPPLVLIEWLDFGPTGARLAVARADRAAAPSPLCLGRLPHAGRRHRQGARAESWRQQRRKRLGSGLWRDHHPCVRRSAHPVCVSPPRYGKKSRRPRDREPPLGPCQTSTKRLNQGVVCASGCPSGRQTGGILGMRGRLHPMRMVSPVMKSLSSSARTPFSVSISPPHRPSGVACSTARIFIVARVPGGARIGSGRDRVDQDIVASASSSASASVSAITLGLRHVVWQIALVARSSALRDPVAEVHDAAAALPAHVRHGRVRAEKRGAQIDVDRRVPLAAVSAAKESSHRPTPC